MTGELISHPVFLGEEGKAVPTVPDGFLEPDVEAIIGMRPGLVIGLFSTTARPALSQIVSPRTSITVVL